MENDPLVRKLSKALIISGALNIILASTLFYFFFKELPPQPYYELKPASLEEQTAPLALQQSNLEVLQFFRTLTFEQLVSRLRHPQLVEDGFSQRDLALAMLVSIHHFDHFRALNSTSDLQSRTVPFGKNKSGEPVSLTIYPALSDNQFQKIIHFAQTEKWPYTSKGLYFLLKKQKNWDATLAEAFYMSPEFRSVENMFQRANQISKRELLTLILQGTWSTLKSFSEQQRTKQDLSAARRQQLLINYISNKSLAAAQIILITDGEFVLSKMDDRHILAILELLKTKSQDSEKLVRNLVISPRSDAVRTLAAQRLYEYAGLKPPQKNLYQAAIAKFISPPTNPSTSNEKIEIIKTIDEKRPHKYVVKEGDSLWKIAKKFKVDIAKLKTVNHLTTDKLRVGSELIIP